jgi:alkanesulfonate monooxygenase SsuD/methylene tetrahydromethanopterin reductase-like flavin-dependent oxidoreductase (luciferase family)
MNYRYSMGFAIRFHVLTLPGQGYSTYRDQILRIEELGFDVAAVPDHFCDWANPPAPWMECWTLLSALAAETSTIRLASNVAQIPLRNPGVLAHQAVTVDHVSGGRLELGLGTGLTIDPGTEMIGLPNWSNAERVARFGEYIEIVGHLLSQEVTSYEGKYYSVAGAVMNPSSLQTPRIPIVAAALGPLMMAHAARWADAWNTMSFNPDFEAQIDELGTRAQLMDELCTAANRSPETLRKSANLFDAEARANGGRLRYYDDEVLFNRVVGNLISAGFTDIGLYYPTDPAQISSFERLATEVIPELRR